jgi:hypothetical protein
MKEPVKNAIYALISETEHRSTKRSLERLGALEFKYALPAGLSSRR